MRLTKRLLSSLAQQRPFYVSTPIFYVNAAPHIGHVYSAVVADTVQRYERLTNNNESQIIFSTGTDEHGTKIQQAATKANVPIQEYCTRLADEYRTLFRDFNVEYTDFVRTTEDRHKKAVHHFWNKLKERDYIYKAEYSGWYSVNDETFVPESQVREEEVNGEKVTVSVETGHKLEWTEETNYMFRLSAFKTQLQSWLKTDGVITPSKYQKQLRDMLDSEVYFPDISVSRPSSRVHWAIRVPDDESQSIYVWLDALVNYLTVTGYPDSMARGCTRAWPADLQVIGKDILKFHGVYWPAFLLGAGLSPPRRLLCHAHWTVDGVKMSKSRGNVVNPRTAPTGASHDALRYFLLREGTMHSDANYSSGKLVRVVNAELADTLGNLASRCCGVALNPRAEFPALDRAQWGREWGEEGGELGEAVQRLPDVCRQHYENYQFYKVTDAVMQTLHLANLFFETRKPWELKKRIELQRELDLVLHVAIETLRVSAIVMQPIIPVLSAALLDKLQIPDDCRSWCHGEQVSWAVNDAISETKKITPGKFVLFQRIYPDKGSLQKRKVSA